ncbi:cutinase family protein [Corynebacterium aquatimens]
MALAVLAVAAVVALAVTQGGKNVPVPTPPGPGKETETQAVGPDWCPKVEFISVPGTWESAPDDDPFAPRANPKSYMLSITGPLQQSYDIGDVRVFTVPYTAQFRNIQTPHGRREMPYDESRDEGTAKLNGELKYVAQTCPQTKFIMAGFSQGAVIVGDVASDIGNGRGVVDADRVLGAVMIADGRRENGVGVNPGNPLGGIGAEIALQPLNAVVQAVTPGATMRGARDGGFGSLNDRAYEICAPDDTICDAPMGVGDAIGRANELVGAQGVHAQYASNPNVIPGSTASEWTLQWARQTIDSQ